MLIIKLIGIVFIITATTLIGYYYSSLLKKREEHLLELRKTILLLRGDIRFANTPLPEAIEMIASRQEGVFKEFFTNVSIKLKSFNGISFDEIWKTTVNENLKGSVLNQKDKDELIYFGDNLGYLDKDMQINTIDLYIEQLENATIEATKTVNEKTRLYNMLGIMAGIFITIVII